MRWKRASLAKPTSETLTTTTCAKVTNPPLLRAPRLTQARHQTHASTASSQSWRDIAVNVRSSTQSERSSVRTPVPSPKSAPWPPSQASLKQWILARCLTTSSKWTLSSPSLLVAILPCPRIWIWQIQECSQLQIRSIIIPWAVSSRRRKLRTIRWRKNRSRACTTKRRPRSWTNSSRSRKMVWKFTGHHQ